MAQSIFACSLLALLSTAATAQAPRPDDPSITVTASPVTRETIRQEAKDYVRATGLGLGITPVARWTSPICPTIIGLSQANADRVRTKIEAEARKAEIGIARRPCQSNIVIGFAFDGRDMARRVARNPRKSAGITPHNRAALVEAELPIRWWYASEMRGNYGTRGTSAGLPYAGGNVEGGGSALPLVNTIVNANSSIVSTRVGRVLLNATIIVDVTKAEGVLFDALAAQVAMVALAEIDIDAKPKGSILSLFSDKNGVEDLSITDRAVLKSLYELPLDRQARYHRGRLLHDVVEARLKDAGQD